MITPYAYRPPNPPARRAGLMLLILGGLALLLGLGLLVAGTHLPALSQDAAFRERLDEIRRQLPFDPKVLFVGYGVVLMTYAAAAITLGLLVRTGGLVVLVLTMILAVGVAMLSGLSVVLVLASGQVGSALPPAIVLALHGLIVAWTIDAIRRSAGDTVVVPTPRRPMQDYYLPPVMPEVRHAGS